MLDEASTWAWSGEQVAGKKRAGSKDCYKKSQNKKIPPKIKKIVYIFFLNSNFSENLDLLSWIQESLQSSKMEENLVTFHVPKCHR
jgi:hypothetical protein